MSWYHRLANSVKPGRLSRDVDREVDFHLRERIDDLRATGMSDAQARRLARLRFGNISLQKERTRDMDLHTWLEAVMRNLRLGARSLARAPMLSAAVVITLTLGIGANSAVFSVIDAVLLRPLAFPDSGRLMRVTQKNLKNPRVSTIAPRRLEDWNGMNSTFQAITGYYTEDVSEVSGELPEKLKRATVGPRFLQVWGISPALGRDFSPEEEHAIGPTSALISDRYWQRHFAANPDAIGKRLRFDRANLTVVGVMPASFRFPELDVDVWMLVPPTAPLIVQNRVAAWYFGVGRLKPGVSVEQGRADLAVVQNRLGNQFPATDRTLDAVVEPLKEETVSGVRRSLWVVFGSVTLLLLIACANIAALLLSRAIQRRQEISIRFSLGASRASVMAQLLTETLMLAVSGAALGLLLAAGAPALFRTMAGSLPRVGEVKLDWRIALYSLTVAVIVTLVSGLIPAIRSTRREMSASLAHVGRSQVSGRHPMQWLLVGVQVALAVTLLAGAGLLLRSFQALGRVSPGFEIDHVLAFNISGAFIETANYPGLFRRIDNTLDFLRTIPGVEASATAALLPAVPLPIQQSELKLTGGAVGNAVDVDRMVLADLRFVAPTYFTTMQIPLLSGEPCPIRDPPGSTQGSAMVNRSFAATYLGGGPAAGQLVHPPAPLGPIQIRGIVADSREHGLNYEPIPTVYFCSSAPGPAPFYLVRTTGDPAALIQTIRRKIHEIEPLRSVFDLAPLSEKLSDAVAENRLRTSLLVVFAITAVSLACIGLYSTLSYLVTLRRREVGLRLALGAERSQIISHFFKQGIAVTFAACIAGLGLALALTRLLAGMLYGVTATDPVTLSTVIAIVLAVGSIASLAPSLRASRVEPMQVLRDE